MNLVIEADRKLVPANESATRRLLVQIIAPEAKADGKRTPLNLALVLDKSGSMQGEKFKLAREGAVRAVRSLRTGDHFSVAVFNVHVQTLLAHSPVTIESRRAAEMALRNVEPTGGTALCEGWLTGCGEAAKGIDKDSITRCLLLTDGLANEGITDPAVILHHAGELRARGVTTSTLGVGNDFDETLLRRMAETGGGSFYFAESATELAEMLSGEVGESLQVVARDVELHIAFPPGSELHCVNGLPQRTERGRLILTVGTLVASQFMELLFEAKLPATPEGHHLAFDLSLQDSDGRTSQGNSLPWRAVPVHQANEESQNEKVALAAAQNISASASQNAMALGRDRRFDEARRLLLAAADRLQNELPKIASIVAIVNGLKSEAARIHSYDERELKKSSYTSYKRRYSRSDDGLSWKIGEMLGLNLAEYAHGEHPHGGAEIFTALLFPGFGELRAPLQTAVEALHRRQPRANFVIGSTLLLQRDGYDDFGQYLGQAVKEMQSASGPVKIAFVSFQLQNNWFSNYIAGERAAVVSLHGWSQTSKIPVEAFLAHHIVLHGLRQRLKGFDTFSLMHRETRGCWGDFCEFRPELEIKLQTGHLCNDCSASLVAAGLDLGELMPMIDAVRELAVQPAR